MLATAALRYSEPARDRNRTLARSFYRQLRSEGMTDEQIVELAGSLLDLVTDDHRDRAEAAK
jgi:hypothetical protein